MSLILTWLRFTPRPCLILRAARHYEAFINSYFILGFISYAAIIITACNHNNTLVVCVPKSGLTSYIIILSILLFLIISDIPSRIFIILFITSFDEVVMQPCY